MVSVISESDEQAARPRITLTLGQHNKARGQQQDLVKTMSTMMERNLCLSDSHPLIAAIELPQVDQATLSQEYNPSNPQKDKLDVAVFRGQLIEVDVLNGRQRVHAARLSFTHLSDKLKKLQTLAKELEEAVADLGDSARSESRARVRLDQAKLDMEVINKTLQSIKFWPVQFYDKGEATSMARRAELICFQESFNGFLGRQGTFLGTKTKQMPCSFSYLKTPRSHSSPRFQTNGWPTFSFATCTILSQCSPGTTFSTLIES